MRSADLAFSYLWPRISPRPERTMAIWMVLAGISLWWAVSRIFVEPIISSDFGVVKLWLAVWDFGAVQPYGNLDLGLDYPPHSLLLLWPLLFVPGPEVFALINAGICVIAAILMVRAFVEIAGVPLSRVQFATATALLLSTDAMRWAIMCGQTTPVALAFFSAAVILARRRPVLAGICLALASFKLNLAAGFGLAFLLLGYRTVCAVGVATALLLTALFALTSGVTLPELVKLYFVGLGDVYGGADPQAYGETNLRPLFAEFVPWSLATVLAVSLGVASLVLVVRLALRCRHRPDMQALVLCSCVAWSLFSLTHQGYNSVLLVPVLLVLIWYRWDPAAGRQLPLRLTVLYLIVAVPRPLEDAAMAALATLPEASFAFIDMARYAVNVHGLRVLVMLLFVVLLARVAREAAQAPPAGPLLQRVE